jgi:hypothetical protein
MKDIISPTSTDGSSGTLGTIRVGTGGVSDAEVFDTASDGSIYLAASTDANNPSPNPTLAGRGFVIKMDSSGNSVWQRYYDTGANYVDIRFTSVKVDSSGNIITAGVFNCQGQARAASQDTVTGVVKWDPSGNILWQKLFKPPSTYGGAASLMTDSSDNIYLVTKFGNSENNAIIKLNSAGAILWQRSFKSNFNAYKVVAAGELSLIGSSSILISFSAGSSVADPYYSPMYLKYPQDGSLTGTYTLGSSTVTIAATSYTSFTPTMSAFSTSDFTISNGSGFTTANIAVTTNTLNQIVTTIS